MLDRALNYRRYHKNRQVKNIARQCEAERTCTAVHLRRPALYARSAGVA
ncbi:MAG: hypothetical protein MZW92_75930 [Comamonadaceae bacterium]|nr:hypothetical protein [Comamonadaceae bacterium]